MENQVEILKSQQHDYCIIVIPLLFETQPNPLIQRVLVIDAPVELQIERAVKRDQMTAEEIKAIIDTQIERVKRLALANDIIYNDGSLEHLADQVNQLHQHYLIEANKNNNRS